MSNSKQELVRGEGDGGGGDKERGLLLISMSLRFKGIIQIGTKENTLISKYSRQVSNDDLSAKRPSSEGNDNPEGHLDTLEY
jgi:hypothetical protein